MYAGHAAVALALKSRFPRAPMVPLLLACYGPDWVEVALMIPHPREGMAPWSHSVPAVLVGAAVAAGLYSIATSRSSTSRGGALAIFLGWLLHWPADLLTGVKPIVGLHSMIGLDLYHLPVVDIALEVVVIAIGCAMYARALARTREQRVVVASLGVALSVLQAVMITRVSAIDGRDWHPALARGWWQPHLRRTLVSGNDAALRTALATPGAHFYSERVMANGPKGVATLVCLTCGKERYFTGEIPGAVTCEQCGGTVFRTFDTPTEPDDATIDALESQARSMAYGDSSPDTTRDDVRDLGLL